MFKSNLISSVIKAGGTAFCHGRELKEKNAFLQGETIIHLKEKIVLCWRWVVHHQYVHHGPCELG